MLSLWRDWSHETRLSKMETRKSKAKALDSEDKKKGVEIEEVNVTHNNEDSDGDKTSGDIFYTNFDPMFLTAEDGYAMSD